MFADGLQLSGCNEYALVCIRTGTSPASRFRSGFALPANRQRRRKLVLSG